jgi:hypothetical protein
MAFSVAQEYFINYYRGMLTMQFHKVAGSDYDGIAKLGDEELWGDLRLGINFFNSYPPIVTTYRFADLYSNVGDAEDPMAPENESLASSLVAPVMMCAMFFTGMRLQFFEAGKHFEYNDNGIYLGRKKQADYANIVGGSILQYLNAQLVVIKKTLGFSRIKVKGLFSGIISYPRSLTRGLRGTRMGSGI